MRCLTAMALLSAACAFGGTARDNDVEMRDGVRLYVRVAAPDDGRKHPCVFKRTPYPQSVKKDGGAYVRRGYVEVLQHCRGFGKSGGFCRPYVEREDVLDTLAWIRQQPWYNGEIFLEGSSYGATVHLVYLADNPPDIRRAAFAVQTDRLYTRNYRNGCCYNFCGFGWWRGMVRREFPDARPAKEVLKRPFSDIAVRTFGRDLPDLTGNFRLFVKIGHGPDGRFQHLAA